MNHVDMDVNCAPQLQHNVSVDDIAFDGLFPISRQNSCTFSRQNFCTFSRQNSLQVKELPHKLSNSCYCDGATCKQIYMRQSKHPRIIEPSSKLFKYGFDKKVQIRIPKELQKHIGYGSCKHCYKALVTLVTYIQLQCGFQTRPSGHKFSPPTQQEVARARQIIKNFGLATTFYVDTWAPAFQGRFSSACGGTHRVKEAMRRFFETPKNLDDDCHSDDSDDTVLTMLQDEPETSDESEDGTGDGWLDATVAMLQEVPPPRSEPRPNASYIERIEAILENDSNTSAHKLSLCNAVLYECLSKQDKEKALSV